MKRWFAILKIPFFFGILAILWLGTENILQHPKSSEWNLMGLESIRNNPNYYDVIISGTSMAVTNISAEELYLKYGIASVSIGEPEQMTFLSYYSLAEALKYQSPKVVLFDIKSLFYSEEVQAEHIKSGEEYHVHYTLDSIKDIKIKYDAVKQVQKLHPTSTIWSYFSKMYQNHANWEEIEKVNFLFEKSEDIILGSKSLIGIKENIGNDKPLIWSENTGEKETIPNINLDYLKKMVELCESQNVKLVLINSAGSRYWTWERYNVIVDLANKFHLEYLDLPVNEEKIGFNWKTDSYDEGHYNVVGAKKWTDFIGEYLKQNYNFPDRRTDEVYEEYESNKEKYEDILTTMEQKIDLSKALNLNQYLDTLFNLEKEGIVIFVSIKDDANSNFSKYVQNLLSSIGFNIVLDEDGDSYIGVLEDGKIVVEKENTVGCQASGTIGNGDKFEIVSGGTTSELAASILINGTEELQGGCGINIVVYNKKTSTIISSVYFDTNAEENPITSRVKDGVKQSEIDINMWKEE